MDQLLQTEPRHLVPLRKADDDAVRNLRRASKAQLMAVLDELLEWTEDGNWPVADGVGRAIARCMPAARPQVLRVLRGPDACWKYFFLGLVVQRIPRRWLDAELVAELRRIAQEPTAFERQEGTDERAQSLLEDLGV